MGKVKIEEELLGTTLPKPITLKELKNYPTIMLEMREYEDKINVLLERKHVARQDLDSELFEIVNFIKNAFNKQFKKQNEKNKILTEIVIDVPLSITRKIDFLKNFHITVKVENYINITDAVKVKQLLKYGNSVTRGFTKAKQSFFLKKTKNIEVEINLKSVNGYIEEKTIFTCLRHEFSHTYQDYCIRQGTKNKENVLSNVKKQGWYYDLKDSKIPELRTIYNIMYCLFNMNELVAFASEIYSELTVMKPDNLNNAIVNSETYQHYIDLKNEVDSLYLINNNVIWHYVAENYKTKSHPKGYGKKNINIFKNNFIKLATKRLKVFYRKMMSAAELYLEINENNESK